MPSPRYVVVATSMLLLTACGPRAPGPSEAERGEIAFWRMPNAPQWAFTDCSDDPSLRGVTSALPFESNLYLTYEVAADGRTASAVSCTTIDPKTCSDSSTGIVLAIDGHTLSYAPPAQKSDIAGTRCKLQLSQRWSFLDRGETVEATIELRLALVDSAADCAALEQSLEARSGNGAGYDGCVMTLTMAGEWATP